MPDWTKPMTQTYEYYQVDPSTFGDIKLLDTIKSSSISRDSTADTLGSASYDISNSIGECYVRTYLVTIQNGIRERFPLGTHLVQTPSSSFNGKIRTASMDAYTTLLELDENQPPIGYSLRKGDNIMSNAYRIISENTRAPVIETKCDDTLTSDFVSNTNDTWLTFVKDLISIAKYDFELDEMGRILFSPRQDTASLQPVWTFGDDNSSILYPDISMDHDIYGIPNVVEIVYSSESKGPLYSVAKNEDENSPLSIQNRGRIITKRETNPDIDNPTQEQLDEYAKQLLRNLSTLEYTVTYSHGFLPFVKVGSCVRLDYKGAGLTGIKAKVISQTIKCESGCQVEEKAVFVSDLWDGR